VRLHGFLPYARIIATPAVRPGDRTLSRLATAGSGIAEISRRTAANHPGNSRCGPDAAWHLIIYVKPGQVIQLRRRQPVPGPCADPSATGQARSRRREHSDAGFRERMLVGAAALTCYVAAIAGANALTARAGIVPVGLGLSAPAGVYLVTAVLLLRSVVQWAFGWRAAALAVAAGAALSWQVASPVLAVASAVAFAVSESLNMAVYTLLKRRFLRAALAGGLAGVVADSLVFLPLAFGSLALLPGQLLGKTYGLAAAAVIAATGRLARSRRAGGSR